MLESYATSIRHLVVSYNHTIQQSLISSFELAIKDD